MANIRPLLWLILFTFVMTIAISFTLSAAADTPSEEWTYPQIGVVIDTSSSMGPELQAFSRAWQNTSYPLYQSTPDTVQGRQAWPGCIHCSPLTATFRLFPFRDVVQAGTPTQSYGEFTQALADLEAGGGGTCPDNALGGLAAMGKSLPTRQMNSSDVLLVTDATPNGKRADYIYALKRLQKRGVNVHSLISGWCNDSPVPEAALQLLSVGTGGSFYRPEVGTDYYTDTLIAHNRAFATDLLMSRLGDVTNDIPDIIPFNIDSDVGGLSIELSAKCCRCLTCTRISPPAAQGRPDVTPPVQVTLRDPDGKVIDNGTQGFSQVSNSQRMLVSLYPPLTATLTPGTWTAQVSGDSPYEMLAMAHAAMHLAYLGPNNLPLNRASWIRAALDTSYETAVSPWLTATFRLVRVDGPAESQPVTLFDDGQHRDGEAGDGIFGGEIQPQAAGWWRLAAEGTLEDGSTFQRLAEVPFRVQPYRLPEPSAGAAKPNTTTPISFTLINDSPSGNNDTTFELALFSEQGWVLTDTIPASVTLAPGQQLTVTTNVVVPEDAAAGTLEEATLVAVSPTDLETSLSAVAEISVSAANELYLPLVIR